MSNKNENKQETLASETTSRRVSTNTTVGAGTVAPNSNLQYGWICPKCGKVYAPWKDSCNCYLNIPYTQPNTPSPTPFNPMPSWPKTPEVGDAPGWWQYGPKCGEPILCHGNGISSDDTVPEPQTASISTVNTDSPDVTTIKAMSEVVNDNPLKDLVDEVFNDKYNLKITKSG